MLPKLVLVAFLSAGTASLAYADTDIPPAGSVPVEQVTSRLQSQGYNIKKIKFDDGRYKVKAVDPTGHKIKLYVSPRSGDVVSKGDDDD